MLARLLIAVAAAVSLFAQAAAAAPLPQLKPVDEAAKDRSFLAFRNELKSIIARKDGAALFKHLASDVKLDYGGGYGGPEFHKRWKPFDKASPLWPCLSLIVDNGGKFFAPRGFAAPYAYAAFPEGFDAFETLIVTNKSAVMRAAPKPDAKIVRKLDLDILTVVNSQSHPQHEATDKDWSEVKDANGVQGFVPDRDLRSPIDYRIVFEKRNGKWVIQTFIAGD